jgi:hypothetical protein
MVAGRDNKLKGGAPDIEFSGGGLFPTRVSHWLPVATHNTAQEHGNVCKLRDKTA